MHARLQTCYKTRSHSSVGPFLFFFVGCWVLVRQQFYPSAVSEGTPLSFQLRAFWRDANNVSHCRQICARESGRGGVGVVRNPSIRDRRCVDLEELAMENMQPRPASGDRHGSVHPSLSPDCGQRMMARGVILIAISKSTYFSICSPNEGNGGVAARAPRAPFTVGLPGMGWLLPPPKMPPPPGEQTLGYKTYAHIPPSHKHCTSKRGN